MILKLKIWALLWLYKTLNGYFNVSVKVLFAQITHETANFESEVYKQNNNLFGMREAKTRKRSVEGTNLNHAVYKNHSQSIVDYFLRQKYFKISNGNDDIYITDTLNSNYAEDKDYLRKWKWHVENTSTPLFSKVLIYGGLFFLGVVAIIILLFKLLKNN